MTQIGSVVAAGAADLSARTAVERVVLIGREHKVLLNVVDISYWTCAHLAAW